MHSSCAWAQTVLIAIPWRYIYILPQTAHIFKQILHSTPQILIIFSGKSGAPFRH